MAADDDPTRFVRDSAGAYHSPDERFSVRNEGGTWYAEDALQLDELGLPHVLGPFPSLTDAKRATADARGEKVTRPTSRKPAGRARVEKRVPQPKPEWTDALPADDRPTARRMARALEKRGIADPQEVVQADILGLVPRVALALIRERADREAIDAWDVDAVRELAAALDSDDVAALARAVARRTLERLYAILDEGAAAGRDRDDVPGWQLSDTPRGRRMRLG